MTACAPEGNGLVGITEEGGSPLDIALAYLRAGLSIIPVRADGSKRPDVNKWERFQKEPPSEIIIRHWWKERKRGIAIIGGAVSGNLECLDFDRGELFGPWCELVELQAPGLVPRLSVVQTPREPAGYHVRYRCREVDIDGNRKLAQEPGTDAKTGKPCSVTLIETRGEGGYAIAPGSPPSCHKTGRTWDHIAGPPLTELAEITAKERELLLAAARSLDRASAVKGHRAGLSPRAAGAALRPGDDYNQRGPDWPEILEPHGWERGPNRGQKTYWRRPGKDNPGFSATTGFCQGKDGAELLAVFSSNAHPFEGPTGAAPCSCYDKFAAYTLLNHGGDFKAAARELARQGYGDPSRRSNGQPVSGEAGNGAVPAGLETTCLATILPEPVRWLVPGYLPLGKLNLLAGDGGHGKSTLTLDVAACLTTGRPCFGLTYEPLPPSDVLLISCEDDFADTVVPRLLSARADRCRVWRVDGIKTKDGKTAPFCLDHFQSMEAGLSARPDVRLVIIDPAGAYIGKAGIDDHKDSELRALLGPLAELAARRRVTILLVKHLVKGATAKAVHKVSGSTGYTNAVRAAFVVAPSSEDPDKKLFLPLKFNLGPRPQGLAYQMRSLDAPQQSSILDAYGSHLDQADRERLAAQLYGIEWLGPSDADADHVLGEQARRERDPNKVEKCMTWLEQFLATFAYPSVEIQAAARREGFTFDNVKEAKARLKESKDLRNSNRGRLQGEWWSGFGNPDSWTLRPATPGTPDTPHSPHSPHTGTNLAPQGVTSGAGPIVGNVGNVGSVELEEGEL
jgi:hypothetical protein